MRTVILGGVLTLATILVSAAPEAETTRMEDMFDQMVDSFGNVAKVALDSLVYIEGRGSGFIVDQDTESSTYYVATNHHVVKGAYSFQVTTMDGRSFDAALIGSDPRYDVALLAFEYSTDDLFRWSPSTSSIGDSDAVRLGDLVYAVGSPSGKLGVHHASVTLGIVSNESREVLNYVSVFIQTDAATNPGNSGGPLVSLREGNVIGINTLIELPNVMRPETEGSMTLTTEEDLFVRGNIGIGFAVPINSAMRIIDNLREYGTPRHGYIGVEYSPWGGASVMSECPVSDTWNVTEENWEHFKKRWPTIMNVTPRGPADRYGLKPGDVILAVDGQPTFPDDGLDRPRSNNKMDRMIDALTPGEDSTFEVIRHCERIEITLQAGALEDVGDRVLASWPGMGLDARLSVIGVTESGVVANLGIKEGDVILHVNDDPVRDLSDFYRSIDTCRTGFCNLLLYRNGLAFNSPDFIVHPACLPSITASPAEVEAEDWFNCISRALFQ